jgi:pyroglutamyl-peptidase
MTKAADQLPTVLLTGFGPFPGVEENASGRLVRDLVRRARRAMPEYRFTAAILPTEWARVPPLISGLHARHAPALVLHFGVAAGGQSFRLETEARNFCRRAADAAGALPRSTTLADDGVETRPVTIAASSIAAGLRAKGYFVSLSNDAGGYLCNAVLYHSLALAEANGNQCDVGFVHIPADLSKPPLILAEAIAGALEIVKFALGPPRRHAHLTSG